MQQMQSINVAFKNGEEMRCGIELREGFYYLEWIRYVGHEAVELRQHYPKLADPITAFHALLTIARNWAIDRDSPIIEVANPEGYEHVDKVNEVKSLKTIGIKNILVI